MLSPHEIATLLLAAAALGPIDADALEPPELAALAQARLVHMEVAEGQPKVQVTVTEDGHRVLRRLGLGPARGEMMGTPRLVARRQFDGAETARAARSTVGEPAAPAAGSEHREEQA